MDHKMRLHHDPFSKIREKVKTIELRLYDEKRSALSIGDNIVFEDIESGEQLSCIIQALHRYSDFHELYHHHDKRSLGYLEGETADPDDMLSYYSEERIRKYGVVGIEIRIL